MNSKYKYLSVVMGLSFLLQPALSVNATALRWGARVNKMGINTCLSKAFDVMKDLGFTGVAKNTTAGYVKGENEGYTADIRCTSNEILAMVAGQDRNAAGVWQNRLMDGMAGSQQGSSPQRPLFSQPAPRSSGINTTKIKRGHNTIETARNAGSITGFKTLKGWVGNVNKVDYWKFQIPQDCIFQLTANPKGSALSTQLLNNDGDAISSEYSGSIPAGTYYIRIAQNSSETYYEVKLSASKLP